MDVCEICNEDSVEAGQLQKLYKKGFESLTNHCQLLNNSTLLDGLNHKWENNIQIYVHRKCRNLFLQKEPEIEEQELAPRQK